MNGPRVVDQLLPEQLARGELHHLWVELVHDGMGQPVRVPVMVARGRRDGPVFGLTAAVHGDELNGIPVIHRLMGRLDLAMLRGTVVGVVVVNVPGFHAQTRLLEERTDLNHEFPGAEHGPIGQVYAHRLMTRLVGRVDRLVDLHTASRGRINSLYVRADMTDPVAARMAYLQRPSIIVHNPPSDGTLRGAASELSIPAITLEIGNPMRFQRDFVKRSLVGLRAVLAEMRMVARRNVALGREPVVCESSFWMHTSQGGLLVVEPAVTDHVASGDVVARLTSVFGETLEEYRAPTAGVVVGKASNPVARSGSRILHLGLPAASGRFIQRDAYR